MELATIVMVIVVALAFDYTNGFHDAANAIATSVATRALTPRTALIMAAVMNLVGAFLGTEVATTVGSGIIEPPQGPTGLLVVLAALIGAIIWNLITWRLGLPSSSSHALIGGLVGAALASSGGVHWDGVLDKVVIPMVLSPVVGFVLAAVVMLSILWLFRRGRPEPLQRGFRHAQTVSAAAMALGHGLQDAQKTMGVIVLALVVGGYHQGFEIPWWVVLVSAGALSAGTYAGGWRIMRTLGQADHRARPSAWFRGRGLGVGHPLHHRLRIRRADLDNADDHGVDPRGGCHEAALGGALGRGRQHRHRLGAHAPDGGTRRRAGVLGPASAGRLTRP